jgi:PAS domain-containing protein
LGDTLGRIHPEDRAAFTAEIERVTATREPFHLEYRMERKDGASIIVEDKGRFFSDSASNLVRMVGFVVDVTARKQAEEALSESEERFRVLADSVPVLIWVNGLDGCEFVNREYLRFWYGRHRRARL